MKEKLMSQVVVNTFYSTKNSPLPHPHNKQQNLIVFAKEIGFLFIEFMV